MIKELVNFTKNLDKDFKNNGVWPSEGLHIFVSKNDNNELFIENYKYFFGTETEMTDEVIELLFYDSNGRFKKIDNKVKKFDSGQKIHSCSPFCFSFNFSLGSNKERIIQTAKTEFKCELHEDFNDKNKEHKRILDLKFKKYKINEVEKNAKTFFINAASLCLDDPDSQLKEEVKRFENFCSSNIFEILNGIIIEKKVKNKDGSTGEEIVSALEYLSDKSYVNFYLKTIAKNIWENAFDFYSSANLFNTNENLYKANSSETYGISGFLNSLDSGGNKPFWLHKTASFEISSRISTNEAKLLNEFLTLISRKGKDQILPNPFPVCVFDNERDEVIGLFREDKTRLGYKEILEKIYKKYNKELSNYYLIFYSYGDILDFDFVSKFEYSFNSIIENLFEIREKDSKALISYPSITNVFELERLVFFPLIQSKYKSVEYFTDLKDIKKDAYEGLSNTFISFSKFRRTIYDYVYKSKRQGIGINIFYDLIFNRIRDDIKNDRSFSVKEKLNIWFSLYEKFTPTNVNEKSMASKLKDYQEFVAQLSMGKADTLKANDQYFAFAAGQVIEYVIQKSASDNKSYQLLEPYLQKAKCKELKIAIAHDIARYKHAIKESETRFKSVCDFVLTYETEINLKELLPELLAGVFSKNQFFHKNENN